MRATATMISENVHIARANDAPTTLHDQQMDPYKLMVDHFRDTLRYGEDFVGPLQSLQSTRCSPIDREEDAKPPFRFSFPWEAGTGKSYLIHLFVVKLGLLRLLPYQGL